MVSSANLRRTVEKAAMPKRSFAWSFGNFLQQATGAAAECHGRRLGLELLDLLQRFVPLQGFTKAEFQQLAPCGLPAYCPAAAFAALEMVQMFITHARSSF